jgi:hypothetical protein
MTLLFKKKSSSPVLYWDHITLPVLVSYGTPDYLSCPLLLKLSTPLILSISLISFPSLTLLGDSVGHILLRMTNTHEIISFFHS